MEYKLSETQQLLQTTARSYLQDTFPWERLYAFEDGSSRLTKDDVAAMAELGWMALTAPEDAGGGGASLLGAAIVVEELGYAGVPAPITASNIAAYLLASGGANELLADLASSRTRFTVGEGSRRFRPSANGLAASGGKLSGTLTMVPFADISDLVLAQADLDGEPALVALALDDGRLEPVELLDRASYANVSFDGVAIDDKNVIAKGEQAANLHEQSDALVTALSTIETAGMMRRVQELTAEYITGRIQFGQPIAKFQAARHRASELLMATDMTRWAAYHAMWRFQEDPRDTEEIWLAKHYAARAADRVYQHSHMLHGGVGVGTEYPLHLFTQGITALAVRNGSMNEMTNRVLEGRELVTA